MKRTIAALLIAAAALPLIAMGGSESSVETVTDWHSNSGKAGAAFDQIVEDFNATIGINRAMNCELTDEYRDKLSPFGLSLFETRANSDIVYPFSGDASWARSGFGDADMAFANATIDGKVFNYPIYTFRDNPDITPAEYFNAVVADRAQNWPADL